MLEFDGINYLAVVVAWVINCVVGSFWYSPAGFAKQWKKHTGVDLVKMPKKESTTAILWVALSALVQAFALAVVLNSLKVGSSVHPATDGLLAGFVLWLGFTAATTVGVTLYARHNWKFLWLNSSYFLIVMAVNSVILAVWR